MNIVPYSFDLNGFSWKLIHINHDPKDETKFDSLEYENNEGWCRTFSSEELTDITNGTD